MSRRRAGPGRGDAWTVPATVPATRTIDDELGRALDTRRSAVAQVAEHERQILELCGIVLRLDEAIDELLLDRLRAGAGP